MTKSTFLYALMITLGSLGFIFLETRKKLYAALLVLAMTLSLLSGGALASVEPEAEDGEPVTVPEEAIPAEEGEEPLESREEQTEPAAEETAGETAEPAPSPEEPDLASENADAPQEESAVTEDETVSALLPAAELPAVSGYVAGASAVPGGEDNDDLFEAYVSRLFGLETQVAGGFRAARMAARDRLTGLTRAVYDALKPEIESVANGTRTSTEFSIPVDSLDLPKTAWTAADLGLSDLLAEYEDEEGPYYDLSDEAFAALDAALYIDLDVLLDALLADLPYELYWYDKTMDTEYSGYWYDLYWDEDLDEAVVYVTDDLVFTFPVERDYAVDLYSVDQSQSNRARTAAENAAAIVEKYRGLSDVDKLRAYKNEICALNVYNDDAAAGAVPYGDPWQLVYVFDGDPATNVVCEGYSKAFQYLCDCSSFRGNIRCMSVTGLFNVNTKNVSFYDGHMWNLVIMDDGRSYMVDVTNCDDDAVGAEDLLFLVPCVEGDFDNGFVFDCGEDWAYYLYDPEMTGVLSLSELTYSTEPYGGPAANLRADCYADGRVDLKDRAYLARALASVPGYQIPEPEVCDLDGDGDVNRLDRIRLARELAGWSEYAPDIAIH